MGNDLVTVIPFSVKDRRKYTLCEFNIDQGHFIIFFGGGGGGGGGERLHCNDWEKEKRGFFSN